MSEAMNVSYDLAQDIIQLAIDNIGVLMEEKKALLKAPKVAIKESVK